METPKTPPGFSQFDGQCPDGNGRCFFVIDRNAILAHFHGTGNKQKLLESALVPLVVDHPAGCWRGLERPDQDHAFCYTGLPDERLIKDGSISVPRPPGKVFAVYISGRRVRDGQYHVVKWSWIEEDASRPGFPVNHATRFGERLWPRD
jgi:hypothetical protein